MIMRLSPREQKIFDYMRVRRNHDVPIDAMWEALVSPEYAKNYRDGRSIQQYLGAIITRINRKRKALEIIPGKMKRTYRLQRKSAV